MDIMLYLSEDTNRKAIFPLTFSSLLEFCFFGDYTLPIVYVGIALPCSWLSSDVS